MIVSVPDHCLSFYFTVTTAVKAVITSLQTTVISDMVQSNQSLQKSVETQSKLIKEQNYIISDQKHVIERQEAIIECKNDQIDDRQSQVTVLTYKFDDLRMSVNDLEQYGRRNSIRINNFKVDRPLVHLPMNQN